MNAAASQMTPAGEENRAKKQSAETWETMWASAVPVAVVLASLRANAAQQEAAAKRKEKR